MRKRGYIEYLDEDGWHLIPNTVEVKKNSKKKILLIPLFLMIIFSFTYSSFISSSNSSPKLRIATWNFKINSTTTKLGINLVDTIIDNGFSITKVIPGTKGKIPLNIDFSNTKVATNYVIAIDNANTLVPKNLKFYTDSAMTQEFTGFQGDVLLKNINEPVIKNIYWKWIYTTEDETVDWSNKDIKLGLIATATQKVS